SRLNRALETASHQASQHWTNKLTEAVLSVMELPGQRVSAAEAAMTVLIQAIEDAAQAQGERRPQQANPVQQAQSRLQASLDNCIAGTGSFTLFGNRSRRNLRVFMDRLAAFARQCLSEDLTCAVQHCYTGLAGSLRDRLRDLSFCRQRLRHLREQLEAPDEDFDETMPVSGDSGLSPSPLPTSEPFWESIRHSATTRVVLPMGEKDLQQAAVRVIDRLT